MAQGYESWGRNEGVSIQKCEDGGTDVDSSVVCAPVGGEASRRFEQTTAWEDFGGGRELLLAMRPGFSAYEFTQARRRALDDPEQDRGQAAKTRWRLKSTQCEHAAGEWRRSGHRCPLAPATCRLRFQSRGGVPISDARVVCPLASSLLFTPLRTDTIYPSQSSSLL
jgi:hypothetical protein